MYHNASPYYKKVQSRLAKARNMRAITKLDRYAKVDHFMLTYEQAYKAWYGVTIKMTYSHGWYYIGTEKYRHASVEKMTNLLLANLQVEQCPPVENNDDLGSLEV